jgi:hypothetical protein
MAPKTTFFIFLPPLFITDAIWIGVREFCRHSWVLQFLQVRQALS